jgi:tetratricopeptide (TPR) repeat protein
MPAGKTGFGWVLAMGLAVCTPSPGWSAGGGALGGASLPSMPATPPSPEQLARAAYNDGVRSVGKARGLDADTAKASDEARRQKLHDKSLKAYRSALSEFNHAVENSPGMFQAWNYIGFCQRHLGDYEAALAAYARTLQLNPGYSEAIEYRGEAYLGLNRLQDAKDAYMTLFRDARPLAGELMAAMRRWIDARHVDPQGVGADELAGFAAWVSERAAVAQQTASLATDRALRPGDWR